MGKLIYLDMICLGVTKTYFNFLPNKTRKQRWLMLRTTKINQQVTIIVLAFYLFNKLFNLLPWNNLIELLEIV